MQAVRHRALAVRWLLAAFVVAEAGALWSRLNEGATGSRLVLALAWQGFSVCLAAGLCHLRGQRPAGRLGLARSRLRPLATLGLVLGLVMLSHGLSLLLGVLSLRDTGTLAEIDRFVAGTRGASLLLAFLALGLAPGLGEEVLFRGWLQQGLVRRLGAAAGIGLASLGFALAHFDPVHSPSAFALGLYLGTVAWLAGSIRPAIVCHVANNLLALALPRLGLVGLQTLPASIPALLLLPLGLLVVAARWGRRPDLSSLPAGNEAAEVTALQRNPGFADEG